MDEDHLCETLHEASFADHVHCLRVLIARGDNVSLCVLRRKLSNEKKENTTPLHIVSYNRFTECLGLLLEQNIDLNVKDLYGLTPVHWVCIQGYSECVAMLLQYGTSVDERDNGGRTSLYYATFHGRKECIKVLLNYGANIYIKSYQGKSPIEIARKNIRDFINDYFDPIKEPDSL